MVAVARVLLESIKEIRVVDLLIGTDLREISLRVWKKGLCAHWVWDFHGWGF